MKCVRLWTVFALFLPWLLLAQSRSNVSFSGVVVDQTGSPFASIPVAIVGVGGTSFLAKTDDRGRFTLSLPSGSYIIRVETKGFIKYTQRVSLRRGRHDFNIVLSQYALLTTNALFSPLKAKALEYSRLKGNSCGLVDLNDFQNAVQANACVTKASKSGDAFWVCYKLPPVDSIVVRCLAAPSGKGEIHEIFIDSATLGSSNLTAEIDSK